MEEAPSRVGNHMVHSEGWAMYTEWLGFYLGLFQKDLHQQFGFFASGKACDERAPNAMSSSNVLGQSLRAARLVVDTGNLFQNMN